jgi:hypothetical protein
MNPILPCVLLASLGLLVGCSDDPANWPRDEFTAKGWSQAADEKRYVYVRDLIDNRRLIGLTLDQVEALLGPPVDRSDKDGRIVYLVKEGSRTSMDFIELLDIRTDRGGKVTNVFVRGD